MPPCTERAYLREFILQGKKGPALITADEDIAAFGFKLHDIVRTPLGITAVVIGVK